MNLYTLASNITVSSVQKAILGLLFADLLILLGLYFYNNRKRLKNDELFFRRLRLSLTIIGIFYLTFDPFREYLSHGVIIQKWPLQICSLSTVIYIFAFYTDFGKYVQRSVVYLSFIGAVAALLFSTSTDQVFTIRFWSYYIGHAAIVIAIMYMVIVQENIPKWQEVKNGSIATFFIAFFIMLPINEHFGTYYFFVGERSFNNIPILKIFGEWPDALYSFTIFAVLLLSSFVYINYRLEQKGVIRVKSARIN